MVWGCFTNLGVGKLCILDRTMDRFYYRQILEDNLLQSVQQLALGTNFTFMHDNDPKHTSALVKEWLRNNNVQVLDWPSSSPGLNPIEHLWDVLEQRVKKRQPKNKGELGQYLIEEWQKIELPVISKLVDSVPNRLNECIKMKGYPTRY
jgi:hypothetical protein